MNIKNINLASSAIVKLIFTCTVLFLTSCGGSSSNKTTEIILKPKSTSLKGDLKDYFEVVEKEYKISVEEGPFSSPIITVEVKRTDKDFDFQTDNINPFGTNGGEDYHVGFGIEIFDESSPVFVANATEGGLGGPYSSDDVKGLMKLGKGETGFIRWSVSTDKLNTLKTFQLSSALEKSKNSEYSSSGSSSSNDWDAVLNEYESFIDSYIRLLKKANAGDMSALSEYATYMDKATSLGEKLADAQGDLSSTQLSRYMKLQKKLMNAAAGM